jgi:hypothetical protein
MFGSLCGIRHREEHGEQCETQGHAGIMFKPLPFVEQEEKLRLINLVARW